MLKETYNFVAKAKWKFPIKGDRHVKRARRDGAVVAPHLDWIYDGRSGNRHKETEIMGLEIEYLLNGERRMGQVQRVTQANHNNSSNLTRQRHQSRDAYISTSDAQV